MSQANKGLEMTADDHRRLAENLGVDGPAAEGELTLADLRGAMERGVDPAFASMGEAIRDDLAGKLDADLLDEAVADVAAQIDRLPEVRSAGIPDEPGGLYGEVAAPGWRAYTHLDDVGFFESVEANLPRFTEDHIERTAYELINADPLTSALTDVGFDEREKTALLMNVVNNNTRLARWVPTNEIPDVVEFDVENVPPLHQRAMGGALLWIRDLDRHLWRKEVLITEEILDDAAWYVKAMLGGLYVSTVAARDVAAETGLTDGQLTAALTAGAAIEIIAQEDLMRDVYYITDDMRAPSELR